MQNVYFASGKTISEQYYDVGRLNAEYLSKQVKLNKRKWSRAKQVRRRILRKIEKRLKSEILTREFYQCLSAWAKGAGITVSEAIELLDDNTGCQTLIARYANGVALIHTEEELDDIKARMTKPQIIGFTVNGNKKYTLVYNNLMPGAAVYGWGKDYALAIDALFLNEDGVENLPRPMLANIVSWILWRSGAKDLEMEKAIRLIKKLGNCVDGYSINIVRKLNNKVEAYKLTFAGEAVEAERLNNATGSYLRQLNIIDPRYIQLDKPIAKWRLPYRRFYRGYWNYYKERLKIIDADIAKYQRYTSREIEKQQAAQEKIVREITGPLAPHYMNEVVGAVCVTLIDINKMSTAIGLIEDSKLKKILFL